MKKRFLFALTASTITAAAAVALMPRSGIMSFAEGCEHVGNHYDAVAATCGSAGNQEFWACCVCHEQFTTAPGKGTWEDKGAYAGPALASTHAAYLAPLEHTPGSWAAYDRGDTIGLNAACSECGEAAYEDDVETATKPVVSTAEFTIATSGAYPWTQDADTGVWTAGNREKNSTVSVMELTAVTSGTIVCDVSVWSEANYDYIYAFKNYTGTITSSTTNTSATALYTSRYNHTNTTEYKVTWTINVAANDKIQIAKRLDGGSTGSGTIKDRAQIKFAGAFTYGLVNFDVCGGTAVRPQLTVNGKAAHDLPTPVRDGYIFDGWYKSSTYAGDAVTSADVIGDDVTLYAKWWDENEQHAFTGRWKGFGFKANTNSTSPNSLLSNYSIDVDYKGGLSWYTSNTTDAFNGTFSAPGADGWGTVGEREYYYNAADGVLFVRQATTNSSYYFWIFVKDSSESYTSNGTVKGCGWGAYGQPYRTLLQFPLADGTNKIIYACSTAKEFVYGASFTPLKSGVSISDLSTSTNVGFEVFNSDGTLYKQFGYNGSYMAETTDALYGRYTSSVAADEYSEILVSGNGKFSWYKGSSWASSNEYKVVEGTSTIYYGSGNTAMEFALDTTNKTFERTNPTVTITYDLGGKDAVLTVPSSFTLGTGNTQKVAKAYDSSNGAWLYASDLASVTGSATTDGHFAFEGWYTDAACTKAFSQIHPTEDITLYAKWAASYSVTCVLNNGSADDVVSVKEGQTPTLTTPTRDGYMFGGWYTDPEFNNPYTPGAVTGDVTVYAKWIEKPAWAGSYQVANIYQSKYRASVSPGVGYALTFKDDGVISRGTNNVTYGNYTADSTLDADGKLTVGSSKYMMLVQASDGRYFSVGADAGSASSDPVPYDADLGTMCATGESVTYVQTTLEYSVYLVKATVTLAAGGTAEYIILMDGVYNKVYAGCDVQVSRDGVVTSSYDDICSSASSLSDASFADTVKVYKDGTCVGAWGVNGSAVKRSDGLAATYVGTFCGVDNTSIVLDGFGNATVGADTAIYTVNGLDVTLTISGVTYKIHLTGTDSFVQVLDGYEGTYTGDNGGLIISGYGTCTLGGTSGTYTVSGGKLKVTVGEDTFFVSLDKTAGTYTVATASPFSGLTFSYDEEDEYGYSDYYKLTFNEGAAIEGTVQFASSSFTGTFEGVYADGVLTLTFHAGSYTSAIEGKTATFAVSDGKLTLTSQTLSGTYSFSTGSVFTCPSFVVPVESTPDPVAITIPSDLVGTFSGYDIASNEFTVSVTAAGVMTVSVEGEVVATLTCTSIRSDVYYIFEGSGLEVEYDLHSGNPRFELKSGEIEGLYFDNAVDLDR